MTVYVLNISYREKLVNISFVYCIFLRRFVFIFVCTVYCVCIYIKSGFYLVKYGLTYVYLEKNIAFNTPGLII